MTTTKADFNAWIAKQMDEPDVMLKVRDANGVERMADASKLIILTPAYAKTVTDPRLREMMVEIVTE